MENRLSKKEFSQTLEAHFSTHSEKLNKIIFEKCVHTFHSSHRLQKSEIDCIVSEVELYWNTTEETIKYFERKLVY